MDIKEKLKELSREELEEHAIGQHHMTEYLKAENKRLHEILSAIGIVYMAYKKD